MEQDLKIQTLQFVLFFLLLKVSLELFPEKDYRLEIQCRVNANVVSIEYVPCLFAL